jgi:mannose-1-phosphate guanylyltransferase
LNDLHVVVPAGGSGTRLWPLSRAAEPKFLHPLTGTDRSLLQATVDRLAPVAPADRVYVVTGTAHAAAVARQLPAVPEANILVEPLARDSCAAIALAAAVIEKRSPGGVMASFAADHLIADPAEFAETVARAVEGAREGRLMTIGITPTRPETGYGYLHCGEQARRGVLQRVLEFKEKPTAEVAAGYVESGSYLWNASMFLWRTDVFLDQLRSRRPDVAEPVERIAAAWDTDAQEAVLAQVWPTIPKVAVEYAVTSTPSATCSAPTPRGRGWWPPRARPRSSPWTAPAR